MALIDPPMWRVFNGSPAEAEANMNAHAHEYALHLFIPGALRHKNEVTHFDPAHEPLRRETTESDVVNVTVVMLHKSAMQSPIQVPRARLN